MLQFPFSVKKEDYRENHLAYMISNKDNPENHPIYDVDIDMGSAIFYNDLCFEESELKEGETEINEENLQPSEAE